MKFVWILLNGEIKLAKVKDNGYINAGQLVSIKVGEEEVIARAICETFHPDESFLSKVNVVPLENEIVRKWIEVEA